MSWTFLWRSAGTNTAGSWDLILRRVTFSLYWDLIMSIFSKKERISVFRPVEETVSLVNELIEKAVRARASDIHFEPQSSDMRVRFRTDGLLSEVRCIEKKLVPQVLARIKVMIGADIGQSRLPQDGKVHLVFGREHFDIRVSTMPTIFGEKAVLRLLNKGQAALPLENLGFTSGQLALYRKAINRPYGLILVTGPTGSGKTTTLYSSINEINIPSRNILTIEDPVEYEIPGISQVQVNYRTGLDFKRGLRSILRQDPDIIMVGEIRDNETAKIAVAAAMTGHLVFSTLHTNSASGAVERLVDMGVEPYLAASGIVCVVAQRLVRKTCPKCEKCGFTGFKGRRAVYEVLYFNERVRTAVKNLSDKDIINMAGCGLTMYEAGMEAVKEGQISLAELAGITSADLQ